MNLAKTIQRALRTTLQRRLRNTADVTLRYDSSAPPYDENVEDAYVPAAPQTQVVPALVHFLSEGEVVQAGFLELAASDAIMDFAPDLDFTGMRNLHFVIDGRRYQQRRVGKEVLEYFDTLVGGRRMFRTVVAARMPG